MADITNEVAALKTYPNNFEAEQSLLCCILIGGDLATSIVPTIPDDAFYNLRHMKILKACKALVAKSQRIDIIMVNDMLENSKDSDLNMFEYLGELISVVPSAANYKGYWEIVERHMMLRRVIEVCNKTTAMAYQGEDSKKVIDFAQQELYRVNQTFQRGSLEHMSQASGDFLSALNQNCKDKSASRGLLTRYKRFDSITNGLQPTDLVILAARPSVGKTSFALNIVSNIIEHGDKDKLVAIFSLEMSSTQLVKRMFSTLSSISMDMLSKSEPNFEQQKELWTVHQNISASQVYVDETGLQGPSEILSKCRRLSNEHNKPLDLIVIDYLGLMKSDSLKRNDSKSNEVGEISRMLKLAAKELNTPIILICQMSRGIEGRDDKTPKLSDLRDSGSIEQDADLVLFLSRENEADKGKPEYNVILDISKHRNGELGEIRYHWEGKHIKFTESTDQYINREIAPKPVGYNKQNNNE
ncbi:MAG: replicative DNA helicase [Bacillota bacterium]